MDLTVDLLAATAQRTRRRRSGWRVQRRHAAAAGLVLGGASLFWASTGLMLWQQGFVWAVILAIGTVVLVRRRVRLFGPVLFYDVVRVARRGRSFSVRTLYALALLLILSWVYASWFVERGGSIRVLIEGGILDIREAARFAESFFYTFVGVQLLAVVLLTPLYVAGAVAEEKERRTLEFLLASDLESREILLSKLVARLAHVMYLLLAGFPVLAAIEFMGGVDPHLVLFSFVMTALTMLSVGSLSLLVSVYARRIFDALFMTYFCVGVLLFLAMWISGSVFYLHKFIFGSRMERFTAGSPLALVQAIGYVWKNNQDQTSALIELGQDYGFWHVLLAIVCCTWAVRRLREVALRPEARKPLWLRPGFDFPPRRRRPKMGERPLLWKEIHGEAPLGSERFSALLVYFYLVFGWLLVGFVGVMLLLLILSMQQWGIIGESMHGMVRALGSFLGSTMLLAVAGIAAGSISRERERQTLDSLLTLPVRSADLFFAKWVGSILSVWPVWWCLGTMWLVGLLTGGLHWAALPWLLAAWWADAAFLASLGLCFSVGCRSSLRAMLWTYLCILSAAVLFRLIGAHGDVLLTPWLSRAEADSVAAVFQNGLAPFASLSELSFYSGDLTRDPRGWAQMFCSVLPGIFCYGMLSWLLYLVALRRFRRAANRLPIPPVSEKVSPVG